MSKSVTFFLPDLSGGGMEKMTIHLIDEFVNRNIDVTLLITKKDGAYKNEIPDKVSLVNFKSSRMAYALPKLIKYLNRTSSRKIVSVGRVCSILLLTANHFCTPSHETIISLRNIESAKKDSPKRYVYRWIANMTYPEAHKVIAISRDVIRDHLSMINEEKSQVNIIHNPAVTDKVFEKGNVQVHNKWLTEDVPVIVSAGRLIDQKNFELLIRAFSKLVERKESRLMILGQGPKKKELINLSKKLKVFGKIDFLGFKNNPYKYFSAADVFALTSKWEGFGNVLVEAMALETPVVATDCPGGPSEILEDGKWGTLVQSYSASDFAEALFKALETDGNKSLKNRADDFRVEKIASKYIGAIFNNGA